MLPVKAGGMLKVRAWKWRGIKRLGWRRQARSGGVLNSWCSDRRAPSSETCSFCAAREESDGNVVLDIVTNISTASDCSGEQVVVESSSTVIVGRVQCT